MEEKLRIWIVIGSESPFFNITIPENNIYNNTPGVWEANVDGFYLFLEPLPPGNHTLYTTTSVINANHSNIIMLQL